MRPSRHTLMPLLTTAGIDYPESASLSELKLLYESVVQLKNSESTEKDIDAPNTMFLMPLLLTPLLQIMMYLMHLTLYIMSLKSVMTAQFLPPSLLKKIIWTLKMQ